jgi:hypothetical protein
MFKGGSLKSEDRRLMLAWPSEVSTKAGYLLLVAGFTAFLHAVQRHGIQDLLLITA